MDERLKVALKAAHLASIYCEIVRTNNNFDVIEKPDGSPVTIADIGSQIIINHFILETFPKDSIVAEEDDTKDADLSILREFLDRHGVTTGESFKDVLKPPVNAHAKEFWTVDPIDGTKGFLRGESGQYAICIAFICNQQPVLCVMAAPRLQLIAYAIRGQGAYSKRLYSDEDFTRITVRPMPAQPLLCCSFEDSHTRVEVLDKIVETLGLQLLRVDSQVKYLMVAMGAADVYIRVSPKGYRENIWDHSCILLVQEAQGYVWSDQELAFPISGKMNCSVLISANAVELLKKIQKLI